MIRGIASYSGIAGGILISFGFLAALLTSSFTEPLILGHLILGAVLVLLHLLYRKKPAQATRAHRRSLRFGSIAFTSILLMILLLVIVNILVSRHDYRWDLTRNKVLSLSSRTVKTLTAISEPIVVRSLIEDPRIRELISLLQYHNPHVQGEFINPQVSPHLVDRYGFKDEEQGQVEIGSGAHRRQIKIKELSEQSILNALLKLSHKTGRKVYLLSGHGEPALDNPRERGLSQFARSLFDELIIVEPLLLSLRPTVPDDASALIVVSGSKEFLPGEMEKIISYVESGGSLFILADARAGRDVKALSEHFGIQVQDDVVIDFVQRIQQGTSLGAQPVVKEYGEHEITKPMRDTDLLIFNIGSSLKIIDGRPLENYTVLARSSPTAWAEKDVASLLDSDAPTASFNADADVLGPLDLAIVYEPEKAAAETLSDEESGEESVLRQEPRVVVFGDRDWIYNVNFNVSGHQDLALNVVHWLVGLEGGVALRERSLENWLQPIPQQSIIWIKLFSLLVPEILLLFGLFVWWRRRISGAHAPGSV